MGVWGSKERLAIGFGPDRVRLMVARGNGTLEPVHAAAAEQPAGALRGGLRAPFLGDAEAVRAAIAGLVRLAREAGHLKARPALVSVVLSDPTVKLGTALVEGDAPSGEDGDRMARWVLRDLLPLEPAEIRASWSVVGGGSNGKGPRWLLSLGAEDALVREVENLVEEHGWRVGRVVPWTLAAATSSNDEAEATLYVCEGDGAPGALFEGDGVPRLHRAWRGRVPAARLENELAALSRYVADHLEATVGQVRLYGGQAWLGAAQAACETIGLASEPIDPNTALLGALQT